MSTQKHLTPRVWAELFLLAILWGAVFFANRIALDEIGPITLVAHRTLWAALLLWLVILATGATRPRSPRLWGAFLVMGVLNNVLPFGLMAWGLVHIESGLAAIFNAATALFGVLIAARSAKPRLPATRLEMSGIQHLRPKSVLT